MSQFELTHIETFGDRFLAVFCRDRETGERVRIDVKDFYPYFYVDEREKEKAVFLKDSNPHVIGIADGYESIEGNDLTKVTLTDPGQTSNLREHFADRWESDILYPLRFKVDADIKSVFSVDDRVLKEVGDNHYETVWTAFQPLHEEKDPKIPKRNLWYDIEVAPEGEFPDVDDSEYPIVCLTAYDSGTDRAITWIWRSDMEEDSDERIMQANDEYFTHEIRSFISEPKMLSDFVSYVRNQDIDILSGWNSDNFDTPYLINRLESVGINPNKMSELGYVKTDDGFSDNDGYKPKISGLWMNDLQRRYEEIEGGSYLKLENIADKEIDFQWEQKSTDIRYLWQNSIQELIDYNTYDVIATRGIDKEQSVTDFFVQKMYMSGRQYDNIERAVAIIDGYFLYNRDDDEILPEKEKNEHTEFGGGIVFQPQAGIQENVAVVDLSKIYPSIMISLSLSYENYVDRDNILMHEDVEVEGEIEEDDETITTHYSYEEGDEIEISELDKDARKQLWNKLYRLNVDGSLDKKKEWEFIESTDEGKKLPNGVRIDDENSGLISRVFDDMFELRYKFEDQLEELDPSDENYNKKHQRLSNRKHVMKQDINGVYGAMGYPKFRLNQPEISECVTFVGRHLLRLTKIVSETMGHKVVYGDTDSNMVRIDGVDTLEEVRDEGLRVEEKINERMDDFAVNFCDIGVDEHRFLMELEKIYERMYLIDAKKRYAGLKVWDEDGGFLEEPKIGITGFEYVRSDSAIIAGEMQQDIMNAILKEGAGADRVLEIVEEYYLDVKEGKVSIMECCPGPSASSIYDNQSIQARAARYMNKMFDDSSIESDTNIYYVYCKELGYNEHGKRLPVPKGTKDPVIGITRDNQPPVCYCECNNCGHEWEEREFERKIELNQSCPECSHSIEDDDEPFDLDGCKADWNKIANKNIKKKAKRLVRPMGWQDRMEVVGNQQTLAGF